ncbi:alpha/beta hydrolase [Streptomyces sp. NPDC008163]|uniref:alpha/beta hydrolase n=1 Tax=Streptomyces sp. NPDC008163 TaxID=3364818 RepID=UPI0036EC2EFB
MSGLMHWEELRSGDSGEVVLAVDSPPHGPAAADFRELTPLLETRHSVWRAVERPHSGPPRGASLDAYLAPWTDEIRSRGLRVRAVLGYSLGGIFAGVIADGIGRSQGVAPEVLLFDPELVDTDMVLDEFRRLVSTVSPSLATGKLERLERDGAATLDTHRDDAKALALGLYSALSHAIDDELDAVGSTAGLALDIMNTAAARLSSLAIAESVDVLPLWLAGTALCSSSPDSGLSRTRTAMLLPEAALVGREILFEEQHAEVLRSSAVARKTSELLGGPRL